VTPPEAARRGEPCLINKWARTRGTASPVRRVSVGLVFTPGGAARIGACYLYLYQVGNMLRHVGGRWEFYEGKAGDDRLALMLSPIAAVVC